MPSSQAAGADRRNERMITHEPPKLKTTLKTPPKQATNPLQFVKVGPCSLYRTAQEQLQKVQEVKKIKQEIRDDPEDWQSNLDNWKSSRRKRQEHIIERVVEVKKLELEEHDRQRRRSKTFSEMMEERGNRGRKLSISLAMYHEEDANDLSDLGIGTSSGKSSISGDTHDSHDDMHSVLSDKDSEIEKNHSDVDQVSNTRINDDTTTATTTTPTTVFTDTITSSASTTITTTSAITTSTKNQALGNGYGNHEQEYDSAITATASSPEPEEYTYEGAIRGYVSRVSQNIPRRTLAGLDAKLEESKASADEETKSNNLPTVKIDIVKRREIFEKASQRNSTEGKLSNRLSGDFTGAKSIKERLSSLEKQKQQESNEKLEKSEKNGQSLNRLSGDMSSIRERLSHLEKETAERENRVSARRKISGVGAASSTVQETKHNDEMTARSIKDRLTALDVARGKENAQEKRPPVVKHGLCYRDHEMRVDASTPSERSSSPDSEYRVSRAAFHRSLDSLDADASSGPDTFERVQSLEELDYARRYPASSSSAELLNDTDREDSGIHTADVSCSVSQADEPVDEDIVHSSALVERRHQEVIHEEKPFLRENKDITRSGTEEHVPETNDIATPNKSESFTGQREANVVTNKEQDTTAKVIEEEVAAICQVNVPVQPTEEFEMVENVETEPTEPTKNIEEKYSAVHDVSAALSLTTTTPTSTTTITAPMMFERLSVSDNYPTKETGTMDNASTVVTEVTNIRESSTPMFKQIPPLILSAGEEIFSDIVFPLGPPTSIEPPKEKPPPPPVDLSDEENQPVEPLKRLNSTRRLKKELRSRRSDFLGLEGVNDDDLERELSVAKPPDMAAILAEERRVEHLHRHSYDTDSNYEQDSSHERDSGVELGHAEDWTKQPVSPDMSQHSRQSSEPFGASVTSSEEDEITKKEREIIEVLEKEEQWRYGNDRDLDSELGEKLAHKLRELEVEKMQLERERAHVSVLRHHEETFRKNADNARTQDETKCKQPEEVARVETKHGNKELDEELRIQAEQLRIQNDLQENHRRTADARLNDDICNRTVTNNVREEEHKAFIDANMNEHDEEFVSGEVLRVERELLQLEQEELKRQRTNLAYREQKQMQLEENLQEQWKSLQDVAHCSVNNAQRYKSQPVINYRSSMPNLQLQDGYRRRAPPPPIPPAKPLRLVDQQHRDVTVRNSRIPSADSIPQQVDDSSLRYSASTTSLSCHVGHQMSRQTLQALSAVPRTRIVQSDQWVQRRRSDIPRGAQDYNYQHWLVQEAEQRRINEKNQRTPVRKQQHMTGTSVPYTTVPAKSDSKPLPDSIIQTLTQRVQNRVQDKPIPLRKRLEHSTSQEHLSPIQQQPQKIQRPTATNNHDNQEKMLSVSGKKKCSHCGDELGRGAAMIIESLRLFYHMECFKCCVCHVRLGDGLMGTDVRVRNHKLHCHNCYSSDDGVKFSCV